MSADTMTPALLDRLTHYRYMIKKDNNNSRFINPTKNKAKNQNRHNITNTETGRPSRKKLAIGAAMSLSDFGN